MISSTCHFIKLKMLWIANDVLQVRPGAYPRGKHLNKTRIRQGWKGFPDANTLAYCRPFVNCGRKMMMAPSTTENCPPCVNFTNVLRAAFAPKAFCHKITNPNCKLIKTAQRALVWLSILLIFYEQLFHTIFHSAAFMCLQFGFVILWQKAFGAKAALKILVKLTPWGWKCFLHGSICKQKTHLKKEMKWFKKCFQTMQRSFTKLFHRFKMS